MKQPLTLGAPEITKESKAETNPESDVVKALETRERKLHIFDAAQFSASVPGAIAIRVPTVGEEVEAAIWAARHTLKNAGAEADVDERCGSTLATIHILAGASRDAAKPNVWPAFGPPQFLIERFNATEIQSLLNLLNEARARESSVPRVVSDEELVDLCLSISDMDPAQVSELFSHFSRTQVLDRFCQLARLFTETLVALAEQDASAVAESEYAFEPTGV